MDTEYATKVAKLNDAFRRSGFGVTITPGVQAIEDLSGVIEAVCHFNTFTEDNDPYKEHDFGALDWHNQKIFWKISYYDQLLQYGEEPLSPKCRRVLTVMLASEY